MRLTFTAILFLGVFSMSLNAQDIHFSQIANSRLNINPALTGIFNGDMRFAANLREQWDIFDPVVEYLTVSGSFDKSFYNNVNHTRPAAFGVLFNFDRAGDSRMTNAYLGLSGSYTQKLSEKYSLTGGAMLGLGQRSFSDKGLRFDEQWTGSRVVTSLPHGEDFSDDTRLYADLSAGVNLRYQLPNATYSFRGNSIDVGVALYHINRPNVNFLSFEDDLKLSRRLSVYGLGNFFISERLDITLQMLGQFQDPYIEAVLTPGIRFFLDVEQPFAIDAGVANRFNRSFSHDAFIPYVGALYRMWHVGLSYDFTVSDFNTAVNGAGELSLRYIITTVKPVKFCPVYL